MLKVYFVIYVASLDMLRLFLKGVKRSNPFIGDNDHFHHFIK